MSVLRISILIDLRPVLLVDGAATAVGGRCQQSSRCLTPASEERWWGVINS